MSYTSASIELVLACISMLASTSPRTFALTVLAAIVLATACWWGCTNYSKLWNTRYHITPVHHILCGIAALATLVFTVSYVALRHTRDIASTAVEGWRREINQDNRFRQDTFVKAYNGVRALNIEDFSEYPPPPGGRRVPLRFDQSRTTLAMIYATEASRDFQRKNVFLSRILWPESTVPRQAVESDMRAFFERNPGGTYMGDHATDLATRLIRGALVPQTARAVYLFRTTAILLFLFFQAIPFTVIGYAAWKDLKLNT